MYTIYKNDEELNTLIICVQLCYHGYIKKPKS